VPNRTRQACRRQDTEAHEYDDDYDYTVMIDNMHDPGYERNSCHD